MKRFFFIFIFFNLITHVKSSELVDDIQIKYQTFNIDTKSITHPFTSFSIKDVVKYHGLYFCLFKEEPFDIYFSKKISHILVIQPDDFSFSKVDIPENIVFSDYSQMFVRNDSILIKGYYENEKDFYIKDSICNEKVCWILKETTPLSSVVFEDDDYKIVFTNKGEWGRYMSFINLSDDIEHIYRFDGGRIFKQSDGYYLCNNGWIGKITNPEDGVIHKPGSDYLDAYASYPETVYYKKRFDDFFINHDEDTLLNAYFMHDNMIYMIETDKNGSYLSKFDGQKIVRLNKLNQRYKYIGCSNLGEFSGGNGGLFYCRPFQNNYDEKFGLIDIDNNIVKIINVITNQLPSLSFSSEDGLKETLAFVTDRFSSKTIEDVDVLESNIGGYKNTLPSYLKYASQYESESMTYYRFVDHNILISAEYGYDSNTGLLNSLFLEWRPLNELTCFKNKDISFPESLIRQKVIDTINQVLSCKPKKKKEESVWVLNGVKIELWNFQIRLLIEKTQ